MASKYEKIKKWASVTDFDDKEFRLNQCTVITNKRQFVESSIRTLDANTGKKLLLPIYEKLLTFYTLTKDENKNN